MEGREVMGVPITKEHKIMEEVPSIMEGPLAAMEGHPAKVAARPTTMIRVRAPAEEEKMDPETIVLEAAAKAAKALTTILEAPLAATDRGLLARITIHQAGLRTTTTTTRTTTTTTKIHRVIPEMGTQDRSRMEAIIPMTIIHLETEETLRLLRHRCRVWGYICLHSTLAR